MVDRKEVAEDGVDVFVEKAPDYRAIHCDGFMVTPNGNGRAVMSVFSERLTIPRQMRISTDSSGEFVEHIVDGKKGLFRQVDASIFMTLDSVEELIEDLTKVRDFIKEHVGTGKLGSEDA